jgi:phytoene synthase
MSGLTGISAEDLAACNKLLAGGSKSFRAASFLLPRRIAAPAAALYAFCRVADDAIDMSDDPSASLDLLHQRLDGAYAGRPWDYVADRAFAAVVEQYGVPRALPAALLEGFAWDAKGQFYEDIAALESYAARVAATVGAMMTLLMGVRSPEAIARACDLGLAMQLTNIARDVGEDAKAGRVYLPQSWLAEEGLSAEALIANPAFSPALGRVVARLLGVAEAHYRRAWPGIALLPWDCRPGIGAARLVYAEIGREVERQGLDSVSRRAVVSGRRKAWLLARAAGALAAQQDGADEAPSHATRFLVDAVRAAPAPEGPPIGAGYGERLVWALELMDRADRETRFAARA